MPAQGGGDQLSEEYAPTLYIKGQLVGDDDETVEVVVGKWRYKAGRTWAGKFIAERWFANNPPLQRNGLEQVPDGKIPRKVIAALQKKLPNKTGTPAQQEIANISKKFRP